MSLEDLLRQYAASGELNYLSVTPHHKSDPRAPVTWRACVTDARRSGIGWAERADVVDALQAALDFARSRNPKEASKPRVAKPAPQPEPDANEFEFG
jgi:hypothetical protein